MSRKSFPYAKFHVRAADHPKVAALSDRDYRAWTEMFLYCADNLTDGFVPISVAKKRWGRSVKGLLEGSLLHPIEGGFELHDYLDWNDSRAEVRARQEHASIAARSKARGQPGASPEQSFEPAITRTLEPEPEPEPQINNLVAPTALALLSPADDLCTFLADLIEANGVKRPTITGKWREEAGRLLRIDGYPEDEVRGVMRWATADDFWKANVLSMPKFRAKYPQLKLAMSRMNGKGRTVTDRLLARANELERQGR